MRAAWICFALCLVTSGRMPAQAPRSPYAAVSGIVLDDATGAAIPRAVVTLSTDGEPPLDAVTFSESNGAFGFTAIPPGKYQLRADMEGFQRAWFGASTPNRPHGTLKLAAGDFRYGITFRLRPLGSISGLVSDQDGDPVPNAQVRLLKTAWERMQPAYRNSGWAHTDDAGRYHFEDVVPGQYVVMTVEPYHTFVAQNTVSFGQTEVHKMYAAQFYPDSGGVSTATPVEVSEGKDLEDIDFHLTAKAVTPIHGKIVLPADVSAKTFARIGLFPQDVPGNAYQVSGFGAGPPNFEFEMPNVTAGPYVVTADMNADGRDYRAAERVEFSPGMPELTLHLERAIDLAGRVDLEGTPDLPAHPFHVSLVPAGYPPGRGGGEAAVEPDGSFVVRNVAPGVWDIDVAPIPKGGYLKSMRLGDQDVLTQDMTIAPDTREPLRIVVSTRGAVVSGTVTVPKGVPRSPRASVLLAPSGRYVHVLSFYMLGSSDDSGHFEFKGVTPGRYQLYAFEEMDPSAYQDPGFLQPFEKLSPAFDVPEGGHVDRETQLIPAGTPPPPRS